MSDSENERIESPPAESPMDVGDDKDNGDDDLFGDGDDDGQLSDQPLSEHDLNSENEDNDDDDERERERYGSDADDGDSRRRRQQVTKEELLMNVNVYRHRIPKSTDGTIHSLRIPKFIGISPEEYHADTFEPSAAELKNSLAPNPKAVARFRRDPATGQLQSNAVVYRWSDGSLTLAIGDEHYEVLTKSLAPDNKQNPYEELQDSHYYAAAAHLSSNLMLTVGHVTHQQTIRANSSVQDDALQRLADRLHEVSASSSGANMIIRTMRDPELAKKEAEMAEKERERARRRRENVAARLEGGAGGSRTNGGRGGALSINDLEGGSGARRSRKRGFPGGSARPKRRRPEYDSDDELPQGARRNDDYDKGDDFIAPSDEEEDGYSDDSGGRGGRRRRGRNDEDDDDEEDLLDDDEDEEEEDEEDDDDDDDRHKSRHKSRHQGSSSRRAKRQKTAEAEEEDDEEDADADPDDQIPGGGGRRGRRQIIDDDEEE